MKQKMGKLYCMTLIHLFIYYKCMTLVPMVILMMMMMMTMMEHANCDSIHKNRFFRGYFVGTYLFLVLF